MSDYIPEEIFKAVFDSVPLGFGDRAYRMQNRVVINLGGRYYEVTVRELPEKPEIDRSSTQMRS